MSAHSETSPVMRLPSLLDLKAAGGLLADLTARRGQDLVLDAGQVSRLGGQCLQVLLSAKATWAEDGHDFSIADASPDFLDGLALLGADSLFEPLHAKG